MNVVLGRINGLALAPVFGSPSGTSSGSATEADVAHLSPGSTIVVRDLRVKLTAAPGDGRSRTFTLQDDGAPTAVTCSISDTSNSCSSGTTSATISPGSELSIHADVAGVLPAAASALFGWRATTP
jgi:hypothetical protein